MNFYWKKEWTAPAISGAVSFAAGVAVGWTLCMKRYDKQIEEGLAGIQRAVFIDRVQQTKDGISVSYKARIPGSHDVTIIDNEDGTETVTEETVSTEVEVDTEIEPILFDGTTVIREESEDPQSHNVFKDDWDVAEEMANRTPDAPYVIHVNEFVNRESGLPQTTLEWYEGDKILADEQNVPIYNPEQIVGHLPFGRGSNDPNVVYIRNPKRRGEYEVVRNEGSFMDQVHGIEAEEAAAREDLRHSNSVPRFRLDRE